MTTEPANAQGAPGAQDHLAPAPRLVARTVELPADVRLLDLLPDRARDGAGPFDLTSWVRDGEGLVGWGRAATLLCTGPDRFAETSRWWERARERAVVRDEVRLPGTGPIVFGSISFAAASAAGARMLVPEVIVGRRGGRTWMTTIGAHGRLPRTAVPVPAGPPPAPVDVSFADGALSGQQWSEAVAAAVRVIGTGELDKVVLARDLLVRASAAIDPRFVLSQLGQHYPNTWVFAVDGLIGATPELLVRREKGLVTSRILAGTIRRTGDDTHDLTLSASLARSSKDLEEHEYAVRSVADALAPYCLSMNVPESPFVLHLPNVMHLATDVAGVLADDSTSLRLAASLHPSAAVCGTPTARAAAMIADLESMDRGRYAGPVGWMDHHGDGEWGLALRCGALDPTDPRAMRLFAGCGIVAGSDPAAELAESDAKLVPMRDALTAG